MEILNDIDNFLWSTKDIGNILEQEVGHEAALYNLYRLDLSRDAKYLRSIQLDHLAVFVVQPEVHVLELHASCNGDGCICGDFDNRKRNRRCRRIAHCRQRGVKCRCDLRLRLVVAEHDLRRGVDGKRRQRDIGQHSQRRAALDRDGGGHRRRNRIKRQDRLAAVDVNNSRRIGEFSTHPVGKRITADLGAKLFEVF